MVVTNDRGRVLSKLAHKHFTTTSITNVKGMWQYHEIKRLLKMEVEEI